MSNNRISFLDNSGAALREYKRRNKTDTPASYKIPVYEGPSEAERQSEIKEEEEAKTRQVAEITTAMVFKNKAIWWFLAIFLGVGIFFILVYTIKPFNNFVCDSITAADGCTKDVQDFNNLLQSKSSKS